MTELQITLKTLEEYHKRAFSKIAYHDPAVDECACMVGVVYREVSRVMADAPRFGSQLKETFLRKVQAAEVRNQGLASHPQPIRNEDIQPEPVQNLDPPAVSEGMEITPSIIRPAGYVIDVPISLSVAVRGDGLTIKQAVKMARDYADSLSPSQHETDGYNSVAFGSSPREYITEVSLESSREETCEVLEELEEETQD